MKICLLLIGGINDHARQARIEVPGALPFERIGKNSLWGHFLQRVVEGHSLLHGPVNENEMTILGSALL